METATPQGKFNLGKTREELNPVIEKAENEDEIIARIHTFPEWEVLKSRIERKIKALEEATKVTQSNIADIDDMAIYGYKCMAKDLLVEAFQGIIDEVERTFSILKEKEDESGTETK